MKHVNTKILGLVGGIALMASTSLASALDTYTSIDALPDDGMVSIKGTVSKVSDSDTIILKDVKGDTIDVHTKGKVSVNVGDTVTVSGEMEDEALGMGEQIVNATITTSGHAAATSKETSTGSETTVTTPHATITATPTSSKKDSELNEENRTKVNSESDDVPNYDVDVKVNKDASGKKSDY